MYHPRFTKVIIHHFMTKKPSIPRRNKAYKEYYACATGKAAPKPNASAKRKRSDSDTSITPPTATATPITTVAAAPRLTTAAKGKQPAKAKSPYDPSEVERTEAEQLKIVLRRSRQETHISQHGSTDEGTDVDAQDKDRNDDEGDQNDESDDGKEDDDDDDQDDAERDDDDDNDDEEEIAKFDEPEDTESGGGDKEETKSDKESAKEETREEEGESFDPIPRTPEDGEDDGNGEEDQGLRVSEEQRLIKEEEADELYRDVDINQGRGLQVSQDIEDSHVTLTPVHLDDKTILESYGDTAILKRRREDDDDHEGPFAGSDRGSKRRREGGEPESASTPSEPATRSASRYTTGTRPRQMSASESAFAEEPVQTTYQMDEPSHPVFETGAEDQPIVQTSQHTEWFSQPRKPPTPDRD
nr:hypothetical protein [Tanacetum cinerariifolium]